MDEIEPSSVDFSSYRSSFSCENEMSSINNMNFNGSIRTRVSQKQSALRLGKVEMVSNYSGRESASENPAAVLRVSAMMNTGLLVTLSLGAIQITKSVSTAITVYC